VRNSIFFAAIDANMRPQCCQRIEANPSNFGTYEEKDSLEGINARIFIDRDDLRKGSYFREEITVASAKLAAGSELSERPSVQEQKRLGCESVQLELISFWSDKRARRIRTKSMGARMPCVPRCK
jgi:hypothetical protein